MPWPRTTSRSSEGSQTRELESPQTWPPCPHAWNRWSGNWLSCRHNHPRGSGSRRLRRPVPRPSASGKPAGSELRQTPSQRPRVARKPDRFAALQPHRDCGSAGRDDPVSEVGDRQSLRLARWDASLPDLLAGRSDRRVVGALPPSGLQRVFLLAEGRRQRRSLPLAVGGLPALSSAARRRWLSAR